MKHFTQLFSATKLVFLAITATVCYGFLKDKIPVEVFIPLVTMVYQAYYMKKKEDTTSENI